MDLVKLFKQDGKKLYVNPDFVRSIELDETLETAILYIGEGTVMLNYKKTVKELESWWNNFISAKSEVA